MTHWATPERCELLDRLYAGDVPLMDIHAACAELPGPEMPRKETLRHYICHARGVVRSNPTHPPAGDGMPPPLADGEPVTFRQVVAWGAARAVRYNWRTDWADEFVRRVNLRRRVEKLRGFRVVRLGV